MPDADRSRLMMFITVAVMTMSGGGAYTQDEVEPTNDLPNPYQTTAPWGRLPEGRKWGALNAVAIDNDGESVWVADRCGANPDTPPGASAFQYDSCAGSTVAPILKFDSSGNLLKNFGAGMFIFPTRLLSTATATCGWPTKIGKRAGAREVPRRKRKRSYRRQI